MAGALPPLMARAWRSTVYRAGPAAARVGRRSPEVDALLAAMGVRRAVFVGAANPLGRRMPEGWNRRMHESLGARLRRLPRCEGEGTAPGWSEPHWLVGGDPRRALRLARLMRQRGIVLVQRGQPARLRVLSTLPTESGVLPILPGGGRAPPVMPGLSRHARRRPSIHDFPGRHQRRGWPDQVRP